MYRNVRFFQNPWVQLAYRVITIIWMIFDVIIFEPFYKDMSSLHVCVLVSSVLMVIGYAWINFYWFGVIFDFLYTRYQGVPMLTYSVLPFLICRILALIITNWTILKFPGKIMLRKSAIRKQVVDVLFMLIVGYWMAYWMVSFAADAFIVSFSHETVCEGRVLDEDGRMHIETFVVEDITTGVTNEYKLPPTTDLDAGDTVFIHKLKNRACFNAEYISVTSDE